MNDVIVKYGLRFLAIVGVMVAVWAFGQVRYAQGDRAGRAVIQVKLDTALENVTTLRDAIAGQNVLIDQASRASEDALAKAQAAVATAQRETVRANQRIGVLQRPLTGAGACARMLELDGRLVEGLRK